MSDCPRFVFHIGLEITGDQAMVTDEGNDPLRELKESVMRRAEECSVTNRFDPMTGLWVIRIEAALLCQPHTAGSFLEWLYWYCDERGLKGEHPYLTLHE